MDKALTNHVIILSFDCLSALDFPILQKLPNFQTLINKGAMARKVTYLSFCNISKSLNNRYWKLP